MHIPVLLHEAIEGLSITEGETILDATLGGAGHAKEFCRLAGKRGTFVGIDQDEGAVLRGKETLALCPCKVILRTGNFRNLDETLREVGIGSVDKIFFDLGFSSDQLDSSGRGFSFQRDEPLMMTLKENPDENDTTARDIVNDWEPENIELVLKGFGEERLAKRITGAIVEARRKKPIETSGELAALIEGAVGRRGKIHPATKTFQALRIAVNDELKALPEALEKAINHLKPGGRVAVISFHSLEDRIVKFFFREATTRGVGNVLTKKPIVPTKEEQKDNPRSRSAKLRLFEKKHENH